MPSCRDESPSWSSAVARPLRAVGALDDHVNRGVRRLRRGALEGRREVALAPCSLLPRGAGCERSGERQEQEHQEAAPERRCAGRSSLGLLCARPRDRLRATRRRFRPFSPATDSPSPLSRCVAQLQNCAEPMPKEARPITLKGDSPPGSLDRGIRNTRCRARPARLPRPLSDPRGDDLPDQPLARRDAGRGRAAAARPTRMPGRHAACSPGRRAGGSCRSRSATRSAR